MLMMAYGGMCAEDDQMMRGQSADDGGATMVLMMVWGAEVLMKAGGADVQWFTPVSSSHQWRNLLCQETAVS